MHDYDNLIETTVRPDGTTDIRTNDSDPHFAEQRAKELALVQASLDALRATGTPRPAVFTLLTSDPLSLLLWHALEPVLKECGRPIDRSTTPGGVAYTLSLNDARRVLRPYFGRRAARLFREASWPLSYWNVEVRGGYLGAFESRTFKDEARAAA